MTSAKVILVTGKVVVHGKVQEVEIEPLTSHKGVPIYVYGAYFVTVVDQITFQAPLIVQIYGAIDEYFRMRQN